MRQVEDAVKLPRKQKLWFSEGADSGDGKDAERVGADDAVPPNFSSFSLSLTSLELSDKKVYELECEPSSEPVHFFVK